MRISDLEGRRVALWGFGREGRAAWGALRARFPKQPLTVFVPEAERAELQSLGDAQLDISIQADAESLLGFDAVIKSPGISPYREPVLTALERGACLTSGTALWFAEPPRGLRLCVTGSKGKSTTSALIAHLLRSRGLPTALMGNIGMPLLELLSPRIAPAVWVIELSSYQTGDAQQPDVAVVLNLFPEHVDWHGSIERYYADKLRLIRDARPRRVVLNALDARLRDLDVGCEVFWFGDARGWHYQGDTLYRRDRAFGSAPLLPIPGAHNRMNLCAALAAIEALGFDAAPLVGHASSFRPLPHRLQSLGERLGIRYVDDSISTTPHATLAALDCFPEQAVALIVGGFDRGIPWDVFIERCMLGPPFAVFTRGQNGPAIYSALLPHAAAGRLHLRHCDSIETAVKAAQQLLQEGGVLLLSPGAPSFPEFRDYIERGRAFAAAAGFDPATISSFLGLGMGEDATWPTRGLTAAGGQGTLTGRHQEE